LLVGTGEDRERLRRRLAEARYPGVHWIDEFIHDRGRIGQYLAAGDVYAFPSRHEGFTGSTLEAMACGLPMVAAAVGGVPDILEGGEAAGGVIVPREDTAALARELGRLLDDDALRAELGRRARCRVDAICSLEVVGPQLGRFLLAGQMDGLAKVAGGAVVEEAEQIERLG
jgi:starch synthase